MYERIAIRTTCPGLSKDLRCYPARNLRSVPDTNDSHDKPSVVRVAVAEWRKLTHETGGFNNKHLASRNIGN